MDRKKKKPYVNYTVLYCIMTEIQPHAALEDWMSEQQANFPLSMSVVVLCPYLQMYAADGQRRDREK